MNILNNININELKSPAVIDIFNGLITGISGVINNLQNLNEELKAIKTQASGQTHNGNDKNKINNQNNSKSPDNRLELNEPQPVKTDDQPKKNSNMKMIHLESINEIEIEEIGPTKTKKSSVKELKAINEKEMINFDKNDNNPFEVNTNETKSEPSILEDNKFKLDTVSFKPKKPIQRDNLSVSSMQEKGLEEKRTSEVQETIKRRESKLITFGKHLNMEEVDLRLFNQQVFELNNLPKCVVMVNSELEIIWYNKYMCDTMGQDKWEMKGKSLYLMANAHKSESLDQLRIMVNTPTEDENNTIRLVYKDKLMIDHTYQVLVKPHKQKSRDGNNMLNLILYAEPYTDTNDGVSIDPMNTVQLQQSMQVFLILIILIFQVPQDLAFNNAQFSWFNFIFDLLVLITFTIDIFLNFFVAFEKSDGNMEQDLGAIFINQISGFFLIDVLATVPFDWLVTNMSLDLSILKSVRIIRFFKMFRILKLSKAMSLNNNAFNNFIGSDLIQQIKRGNFFLDLVIQNGYILLICHFQATIFFYIKMNFIQNDINDRNWLQDYQGIDPTLSDFQVQVLLVSESCKTSVGLGVGARNMQNPIELVCQTLLMFVGLTIFGQGIGHICAFLNHMNQTEIEQSEARNQYKDVCDFFNVDEKVARMLQKECKVYFNQRINENIIDNKNEIISPSLFEKLEGQAYRDFIENFSLFKSFSMPIIRHLKEYSTFSKNKFAVQQEDEIESLHFITKGKVSFFDSNMRLVNDQAPGDIYGFSEFLRFIRLKQSVDFDELLIRLFKDVKNDPSFQYNKIFAEKMHATREQIRAKMASQQAKKNIDVRAELNWFTKQADQNNIKLVNKFAAVSTDDLVWFSIPFDSFEGILFNEFEPFFNFQKQWKPSLELIRNEDINNSSEAIHKYSKSTTYAMICSEANEILYMNNTLIKNCQDWIGPCLNTSLIDQIRYERETKFKLSSVKEIGNKHYKFWKGTKKLWLKVKEVQEVMIRNSENLESIQHLTHNNDKERFQWYNLKKSLTPVVIIQFEFEDYIRD